MSQDVQKPRSGRALRGVSLVRCRGGLWWDTGWKWPGLFGVVWWCLEPREGVWSLSGFKGEAGPGQAGVQHVPWGVS